MKYKPGGYTGFLTAGQIPSFCSIRKHIVVIFAHANRLLVMDYRHTETSISGKYITRILVNLKQQVHRSTIKKFLGGILTLQKKCAATQP